ncbi:TPA: hypothetical protein ACGJRU_003018 [Pseudomonas aeruginosa]|uniref:hypothetical protein n=1 Tax=Pseudomonas aeruginosa TaxID=287 RepID=UPI00053EA553|nr:hypothetical protein [Pseudomonas aeruginosa]NRF46949.1 hypothetical protein [Stutzerimonas stutzeri]
MARAFPIEVETLHTATVRVRIIPREALAFIAAKRAFAEAVTKAAEAHEVGDDWNSNGDQVYVAVFSSDVDRDGVFEAAQDFSKALAGMDIFKAP